MAIFIFAALTVIGAVVVTWGTAAVATPIADGEGQTGQLVDNAARQRRPDRGFGVRQRRFEPRKPRRELPMHGVAIAHANEPAADVSRGLDEHERAQPPHPRQDDRKDEEAGCQHAGPADHRCRRYRPWRHDLQRNRRRRCGRAGPGYVLAYAGADTMGRV